MAAGVFPLWQFPNNSSKVPVSVFQPSSGPAIDKLFLSSWSFLLIGLIDAATAVWYFTWRKVALPDSPAFNVQRNDSQRHVDAETYDRYNGVSPRRSHNY